MFKANTFTANEDILICQLFCALSLARGRARRNDGTG
jgi:hypothetical protein